MGHVNNASVLKRSSAIQYIRLNQVVGLIHVTIKGNLQFVAGRQAQ